MAEELSQKSAGLSVTDAPWPSLAAEEPEVCSPVRQADAEGQQSRPRS